MAGWADYNLSDGLFGGKQLFTTMTALRNALIERLTAVDDTIPGTIPAPTQNKLIDESWLDAFQSEITALIPQYVNHTINGGDFEGEVTIPNWSEATLLASLGESRVAVPEIYRADWAKQQYDIINLLRWLKVGVNSYNVDTVLFDKKDVNSGVSWADAESLLAAASWTFQSSGQIIYVSDYAGGGPNWLISATRQIWPFSNPDFSFSVDIYYLPQISAGDTFLTVGNIDTNNVYNLARSSAEASSHNMTIWQDAEIQGLDDPDNAPTDGYGNRQNAIDPVLKFDGASGFTYKDW